MLNKNVCPNCGQLYDTNLDKCPLCGTAPQVVDTADPVQRKRITEAERKQRRADRKEAEQEAKRRRKDEQFMQDADEERLIEEEEARRKEEKRRRKEEKKAARRAKKGLPPEDGEEPLEEASLQPAPLPAEAPAPAAEDRDPVPAAPAEKDRGRVPRFYLIASTLLLGAALLVGGSYLLWKTDTVKLPFYDQLAARKITEPTQPAETDAPAGTDGSARTDDSSAATQPFVAEPIPCTEISLGQTELVFSAEGEQLQLPVTLSPANTTDERSFSSSDPAVVKVSPVGIVTAVGPGEAAITVSCGSQSAVCAVKCEFAAESGNSSTVAVEELTLIKDDMTFFAPGENYVLSVTNVPAGTAVSWRSLDESVCTVDEKGHVVAVGEGTTRVFATVGELEAFCWVRCRFE